VIHFNGLDPAEAERLYLLAEECAEVIVSVNKILRHGYASHNPDAPEDGDNREQLSREIGDVRFVVDLMLHRGDVDAHSISAYAALAKDRKAKYVHHQDGYGDNFFAPIEDGR